MKEKLANDELEVAVRNVVVETIYSECRKKGHKGVLLVQFMDNDTDFTVSDQDGIIGMGRWNQDGSLNLIIGEAKDKTIRSFTK